ncbi:MAG: hypothetical protein HY842_01485 [Bacteroidetes bacterium]|nr:hypothetical protein [Bacteroidota bacterium]
MKIKRLFFYLVAAWCIMCLTLRCYMNLAGFQTGRTTGDGKVELMTSLNQIKNTPNWTIIPNDNGEDIYEIEEHALALEIDSKFGITDRFDFGISLGSARFGINGKYNFYNHDDQFSLAAGLGAGFALGGKYLQSQIFASIHPSEKFAVYCNPSYALTFLSSYSYTTFDTDNLDFYGANLGFLYGEKMQIGVDLGIYTMSTGKKDFDMFSLGIGAKFLIGKK